MLLLSRVATVLQRWQGDLSYSDIARATGMSVSGVSEAIRGVVLPRPETIATLCRALGHTEEDLIRAMAEDVGAVPRGES